jgi:hypothetical protein
MILKAVKGKGRGWSTDGGGASSARTVPSERVEMATYARGVFLLKERGRAAETDFPWTLTTMAILRYIAICAQTPSDKVDEVIQGGTDLVAASA